jgi:nitrile hydratase
MADRGEQEKQWAKIVAKAWADEDYKQRLLDDPKAVLAAEGIELPDIDIKVVEATEKQAWMVLPPKPADGEIEQEQERISAGTSVSPCCVPM